MADILERGEYKVVQELEFLLYIMDLFDLVLVQDQIVTTQDHKTTLIFNL